MAHSTPQGILDDVAMVSPTDLTKSVFIFFLHFAFQKQNQKDDLPKYIFQKLDNF